MAEFWFLFICNMLIPVTMLVLGYLFKGIHFPKDVNALCGYRTSMSMKNEKTWKFANAYWGKICWRIGWGVTLVTAFATILSYLAGEEIFNTTSIVLCMGQCAVLLVTIIPVERALKKKFDRNGESDKRFPALRFAESLV